MPAAATRTRSVQLSQWQRKVAGLVQSVETLNTLLLAGGRGGGKSVLLVWLIIYFALLTGESFNGVLIRCVFSPGHSVARSQPSWRRTTDPLRPSGECHRSPHGHEMWVGSCCLTQLL